MSAIQPALDGTMPEPPAARRRSEDYETWIAEVRPVFEEVAATGRPFTCYEVADEHDLPEPPDTAHHWGRLIGALRDDELIYHYGWDNSRRSTSHGSGVRVWRGTRAARRAAA